jgi:hypothetical protein
VDRKTFWQIIDDAQKTASDVHGVAPVVVAHLKTLESDDIIGFAQNMSDVLDETYRWDLWAVGFIVNGGCSDDGFEYFRAWLVAQGSERFEAALTNPAVIGQWAQPYENECEDLMSAGWDAFHAKYGSGFPDGAITGKRPADPTGDSWEEDELEKIYPELCKKFF